MPVFVVSTVAMSMMLGHVATKKMSRKRTQKDSGKSGAKQVINLIETQEIPTMDPALSADAVSSRVMTNTMEGLYSLEKMIS